MGFPFSSSRVQGGAKQAQKMPAVSDPRVQELRALDLSGWQLHQQQFATALDDLRAQRLTLERKRLEVESQALEQYFK